LLRKILLSDLVGALGILESLFGLFEALLSRGFLGSLVFALLSVLSALFALFSAKLALLSALLALFSGFASLATFESVLLGFLGGLPRCLLDGVLASSFLGCSLGCLLAREFSCLFRCLFVCFFASLLAGLALLSFGEAFAFLACLLSAFFALFAEAFGSLFALFAGTLLVGDASFTSGFGLLGLELGLECFGEFPSGFATGFASFAFAARFRELAEEFANSLFAGGSARFAHGSRDAFAGTFAESLGEDFASGWCAFLQECGGESARLQGLLLGFWDGR